MAGTLALRLGLSDAQLRRRQDIAQALVASSWREITVVAQALLERSALSEGKGKTPPGEDSARQLNIFLAGKSRNNNS
jgi:hypothetical protein